MGFALKLSRRFGIFRTPPALAAALGGKRFNESRDGGAAVEFAIVGPVLLLLLSGIFTYGGYFLTAHTVQQFANDAARAAIAGLDDAERLQLARDSVRAGLASQPYMRGEFSTLELERRDSAMTVRVVYDASDDVYWAFASLLPVPAPNISRHASIRLGGY